MENEPSPPATEPTPPTSTNPHTMGMLCHLLALCGLLGVPFGNVLGPLVMWLVKREEIPFVDECGKEAVNFQISMTIYTIVAGLLLFAAIGFILLPAILIMNLVFTIIASIQAGEGRNYQYPLTIRIIK